MLGRTLAGVADAVEQGVVERPTDELQADQGAVRRLSVDGVAALVSNPLESSDRATQGTFQALLRQAGFAQGVEVPFVSRRPSNRADFSGVA